MSLESKAYLKKDLETIENLIDRALDVSRGTMQSDEALQVNNKINEIINNLRAAKVIMNTVNGYKYQ